MPSLVDIANNLPAKGESGEFVKPPKFKAGNLLAIAGKVPPKSPTENPLIRIIREAGGLATGAGKTWLSGAKSIVSDITRPSPPKVPPIPLKPGETSISATPPETGFARFIPEFVKENLRNKQVEGLMYKKAMEDEVARLYKENAPEPGALTAGVSAAGREAILPLRLGLSLAGYKAPAFEKAKEEYMAGKHPLATGIGATAGMLAPMGMMSKALAPIVPAIEGMNIAGRAPMIARTVAHGIHTGAVLGAYGLTSELTRQRETGEFDPKKLATVAAKNAGFGLALGPTGLITNVPVRVGAYGSLFGGQAYLEGGSKEDIALNASLGMLFGALQAKDIGDAVKKEAKVNAQRHLQAKLVGNGVDPREAKIVSTRLFNVYIEKNGGIKDFKINDFDTFTKSVYGDWKITAPEEVRAKVALPYYEAPNVPEVLKVRKAEEIEGLKKILVETKDLKPTDKINSISVREAGKRIVAGDPTVIPHLEEGVKEFGVPTVQDNVINKGVMPELAKRSAAVGPAEAQAQMKPILDEVVSVMSGKPANIPEIPVVPPQIQPPIARIAPEPPTAPVALPVPERGITPQPIPETPMVGGIKPEIITDQSRVQEIKNSIMENELTLKTGKFNGRKLSPEELMAVQRTVDSEKRKIGIVPSLPAHLQKLADKMKGYSIEDVTPAGYGPTETTGNELTTYIAPGAKITVSEAKELYAQIKKTISLPDGKLDQAKTSYLLGELFGKPGEINRGFVDRFHGSPASFKQSGALYKTIVWGYKKSLTPKLYNRLMSEVKGEVKGGIAKIDEIAGKLGEPEMPARVKDFLTDMDAAVAEKNVDRLKSLSREFGRRESTLKLSDKQRDMIVDKLMEYDGKIAELSTVKEELPSFNKTQFRREANNVLGIVSKEFLRDKEMSPKQRRDQMSAIKGLFEKETVALSLPKEEIGMAININLKKMITTEDARDLIRKTADVYAEKIESSRGKATWAQTKDLASMLDMSPEKLVRMKGALTAAELEAARQVFIQAAQDVSRMARIAGQTKSEVDLSKAAEAWSRFVLLQASYSGKVAEAGRALNILRSTSTAAGSEAEKARDIMTALGGREFTQEMAERLSRIDPTDIVAFKRFLNSIYVAGPRQKVYELWLNSILSSPVTHMANMIGNFGGAIYSVPERAIAVALDKAVSLRTGKRTMFARELPAQIVGMSQGLIHGLARGLYAFNNANMLSGKFDVRMTPAIKGIAGEAVRTPTKLLYAEDEFFKAIIGTAEKYALAARQATIEKLTGKAFNDRVAKLVSDPTPEMWDAVKDEELYRTFQTEMPDFGRKLMALREAQVFGSTYYNPLKYVLPFIKTPVNIFKVALTDYTPLGAVKQLYGWVNGEYKAGNGKVNQEKFVRDSAKTIMGSLVCAAVVLLVSKKLITGRGPKDKTKRELLYATGWQPNSVKIGNKYISYKRIQPLGIVMSTIADTIERQNNVDDATAGQLISTLAANMADQTFLTGLSNAINAVLDPDRYGDRWISSMASGYVPMSSLMRVITYNLDPTVRQPRGIKETIMAELPGAAKNVPEKVDVLGSISKRPTGIPYLLAMPTSTRINNKLAQEMVRLDVDIPAAPRSMSLRDNSKIALTREEQNRFLRERGEMLGKIVMPYLDSPDYAKDRDDVKKEVLDMLVGRAHTYTEKIFKAKKMEEKYR